MNVFAGPVSCGPGVASTLHHGLNAASPWLQSLSHSKQGLPYLCLSHGDHHSQQETMVCWACMAELSWEREESIAVAKPEPTH